MSVFGKSLFDTMQDERQGSGRVYGSISSR